MTLDDLGKMLARSEFLVRKMKAERKAIKSRGRSTAVIDEALDELRSQCSEHRKAIADETRRQEKRASIARGMNRGR